jgi:hypothetical protein
MEYTFTEFELRSTAYLFLEEQRYEIINKTTNTINSHGKNRYREITLAAIDLIQKEMRLTPMMDEGDVNE